MPCHTCANMRIPLRCSCGRYHSYDADCMAMPDDQALGHIQAQGLEENARRDRAAARGSDVQTPMQQIWTVDECPDAQGFHTIRLSDGTPNGNTDEQPIATVYDERDADMIATTPELLAALEVTTEALDNCLLHLGANMPPGDRYGRTRIVETNREVINRVRRIT